MALVRKDYIERLIEEVAAAFAAILRALSRKDPAEAEAKIEEASRSLLGMEYRALAFVDAASAARLLDHPERIKVLAKLVAQKAEVFLLRGERVEAAGAWQRSLELWEEVRARKADDAEVAPATDALRERLAAEAPPDEG